MEEEFPIDPKFVEHLQRIEAMVDNLAKLVNELMKIIRERGIDIDEEVIKKYGLNDTEPGKPRS